MPNPFTRDDTMLGVCQAIGEEIGVDPLWLRVGFGALLFWNIGAAVASYLALGVAVLALRLLWPARVPAARPVQPAAANDEVAPALDLAA